MTLSTLAKKLRLTPGMRALVLNAPTSYEKRLQPLPEDVSLRTSARGPCEFAQVFAKNRAELERLAPRALDALRYDGVFWMAYPKRTSNFQTDLNRDRGWDVLRTRGLRPVAAVLIDETWSALRFRPVSEVKARSKRFG